MAEPSHKELALLVEAAQKGDSQALRRIISLTQDRLYKFCLYLCGYRPLAQDLCQDTYVKVLEKLHKIKNPEGFLAWLMTTAKNQYFDYLRSQDSRQLPLDSDFEPSDEAQQSEQNEQSLVLKQALSQLTPDERITLLLIDLEGYSYAEAAKIQGISENAMRSRIFRARQELLQKIDPDGNESPASFVFSAGRSL